MAPYSREETVAAVQDFIAFATKMYLDETAYESPPSTGWPSITPNSMRFFGKTDEAVQVLPALSFAGFQLHDFGQSSRTSRVATEGMIYEHVPAHVVGLAMRRRQDHGVLVDTKLGVVYWHEAATEFKWFSPFPVVEGLVDSDDESEGEGEGMSPGERSWRGCETVWSIPDSFATLKHNLAELHFVPMSRRHVVDGWYGLGEHGQEAVDMVKEIYREHGWPDLKRYRKEDCLRAIYTALSENFPGEEHEEVAEFLEA
ncbi:hypothetical protein OQA88_10967 [Cercophora sp. LCS_1]